MKRILFLTESLEAGGAQRQLAGLAAGLRKKGFEVKLVCYYDRPFYQESLLADGVQCECVADGGSMPKRLSAVAKAISAFKPDAVIAFLDIPGMMACLIKALSRGKWKLIVSERNTTQSLTRRQRLKFYLYRFADKIVSNSHSQHRFISAHFPRLASKTEVITNFVDTDHFSPGPDTRSQEGMPRIICVGRVVPQKNVVSFLKACAILRERGVNFKVDWFGERYPGAYDDEVSRTHRDLGLGDLVSFNAATKDISSEYRNSDIFCLPSLYEGFPNVLCEAMACGLPAVCSDVCDNPSILESGKGGFLFNPESAESMADAIEKLLAPGNEEIAAALRRKLGEYNRQVALQLFSPSKFFQKYMECLR